MSTIKTSILIISDTHCAPLTKDGISDRAFRLPLPKADLLIHCGDLTMTGQMDEYYQTLDMLKQIEVPVKLVIAGNHDLSLDKTFVQSHRTQDDQARQPAGMSEEQARQRYERARELWTADTGRARAEGITFLDEGIHVIELQNGASVKVYASPYTPEFYDWAFAYARNEDRFNSADDSFSDAKNIAATPIPPRTKHERPLDVVVTHGPPWLRLDPTTRGDPAGCPFLLKALMRSKPQIHCFGHIHEGWGAERIRWAKERTTKASIQEFKDTEWRNGIAGKGETVSTIAPPDEQDMLATHAVRVDLSTTSAESLANGEETLVVNAAIMDVNYKPANTPWLIDIDLPAAQK